MRRMRSKTAVVGAITLTALLVMQWRRKAYWDSQIYQGD